MCVRIIRMDNVDIGLFEHDRNDALYFYLLNADSRSICVTAGGIRGRRIISTSIVWPWRRPRNWNCTKSITKESCRRHPGPRRILRNYSMLVDRTFKSNACVECHLIGDFQNLPPGKGRHPGRTGAPVPFARYPHHWY